MKKINKRRISLLILIVIMVIIEIIAFGLSRAQTVKEISVTILDHNNLLAFEECTLNAIDGGESGYYITLPETLNNKLVSKYLLREKEIDVGADDPVRPIVEKNAGDRIYLTEEELANQSLALNVEYDTKVGVGGEGDPMAILYYQKLETVINGKSAVVEGYMLISTTISIEESNIEIQEELIKKIYNIELFVEGTEYKCEDLKIHISGMEEGRDYKVIDIEENIYIVLKETSIPDIAIQEPQIIAQDIMPFDMTYNEGIPWDGSVATKFAGGNGDIGSPYLITDGSELAYLRQQVNAGNMYVNRYFQLTNDINLGGNTWAPIGTYSNSFRGIFNGAGHTISNTVIQTKAANTANVESYGIFGSIGGGTTYAEIKNLELINITIRLGTGTQTFNTNSGYHVGFVVGTIYNDAKVTNCIVKSSGMSTTNTLTIGAATVYVSLGGIAGSIGTHNTAVPTAGHISGIENCYVSANIITTIAGTGQYCYNFSSGGIVGRINNQPVWPINCLYTGTINTHATTNLGGFIGPIFGSLVGNTTAVRPNSTTNYTTDDTVFSGTSNVGGIATNLTTSSYFTSYTAKTNTFNSSSSDCISGNTPLDTAHRRATANTSDSMARYQGVNKGIYTNNMNTMLAMFNSYGSDVSWKYEGGTFSLIPRLTATPTEPTDFNYVINVDDPYNIGNYNYKWYINDAINTGLTGNTFNSGTSFTEDRNVLVIIDDGIYYTVVKYIIPKLYINIELTYNGSTKTLTGNFTGTGVPYVSDDDYTFIWYKEDISGYEREIVEGANTRILTGVDTDYDYALVATHKTIPQLSVEAYYSFGTVIYVNYTSGVDTRDGFTPETAVKTMSIAYGKISASNTVKNNVIVVMGNYTDNTYINAVGNTYTKQATLTGVYKRTNYNGNLTFHGNKFLESPNTTFQYMTLSGTGAVNLYLYAQGNSITFGESVIMTGYTNTNTANSSNGQIKNGNAPEVHIIGGYLNYNRNNATQSIPNNDSIITIKSGTYGRIITGNRNEGNNTTSGNVFGKSTNPFNATVIIDIKNSTKATTHQYDINLLVGGQTDGSIYANTTIDIRNGNIGRILGASIGYGRQVGTNPPDSFFGSTHIMVSGGRIEELYGGSLGRNTSTVYFYGTIEIDISGGYINANLYGAGAGGVTGYHASSTDTYKNLGQGYTTNIDINITGGTINGNIYGAGYGFSDYLTSAQVATDGGTLYGNSTINITGGTVNGNIFGAGRGTVEYNTTATRSLAQMVGNTNVTITGNPSINGSVYGAGEGIATAGFENTAKLTGDTYVYIENDIGINVYGGGNASQTVGNTNVHIDSGIITGTVYGGGNLGFVTGVTNVNINGGQASTVYGGGQSSNAGNTNVNILGGEVTTVFGGSNITGTVTSSNVNALSGTVGTIYGGNNAGGNCLNTLIKIDGSRINTAVYGGGNQAVAGITTIDVLSSQNEIPNIYGGGYFADVTTSNVNIKGATIANVYGGNNAGGITNISNVKATGGTVASTIYGGGRQANTGTTYVTLTNLANTVPQVYGGGHSADATTTNVTMQGVNATNVYGGSNTTGTVNVSNVIISNGIVDTIYGGNNAGGVTNTSNVKSTGGAVTSTIYGGGRQADTVTTYVTLTNLANTIPYVYGGGHAANVSSANVTMQGVNATNVYGGSNTSGVVNSSDVIVKTGNIDTVYGGGNIADTVRSDVEIEGGIVNNVFGGGNAAKVEEDTHVSIKDATILTNAYGGGNEGEVLGNTEIHIQSGIVEGSLYAGGNGVTAIVHGSTEVNVEGQSIIGTELSVAPNSGCVFGGGNAAGTGLEEENNSSSIVNIVGGTIYGNVYGGANTSVVYGTSYVNIGYNAVNDNELEKADIYVKGTIFGGGEANASGSEVYDYSFISVTGGIRMNIDGTGHTSFRTQGSIFGSGNASSTTGTSIINIKNYGTIDNPQKNISIQRATTVTLDNSSISLSGATDRTNEYASYYFSLSRIDELKLKNNSSVYLAYGANLLKKVSSLVDVGASEVKATVTIDENGNTVKNVDNRIYLLEGKNLNVATTENASTYGEVDGMMFLGLYTSRFNAASTTAFYNNEFDNGDLITNPGTFSANAYVLGRHKENHDIIVDGFYTNYNDNGYVKTGYVGVTPEDDQFYMWYVGDVMDVTTFDVSITASKYATLGTHELVLLGFGTPNTKFTLTNFSSGLIPEASLIDHKLIKDIADTEQEANTVFGLGIKSGRTGWKTNNSTDFYSANDGSYSGSSAYDKDSGTFAPTILFSFYHSANISTKQELGNAKIRFQARIPVDDLTYELKYIDINLTLLTAIYQDNYYEAAIAPGEEYDFFSTTETNITKMSTFSTYYSLYIPKFSTTTFYADYKSYKHVLVSKHKDQVPYAFKANSRIIMLDMVTNKYYYYVVTEEDESSDKYMYKLSDFILMGSTNEYYNEPDAATTYYRAAQDLVLERFIFHVSFAGTNLNEDLEDNTLLLDLQTSTGETRIGVLGIQREPTKYGVYLKKDGVVDVTVTLEPNVIYLGKTFNANIETLFSQQYVDSKIVYDTNSFDKKLGMKLSIYNDSGVVTGEKLLGVSFLLDGIRYYPRTDGSVRIKLADRPANIISKVIVDTANNSTLPTGTYKLRIEAFVSPDGIYYGGVGARFDEKEITIINSSYGLKAKTDANSKIVNHQTGFTDNGDNVLDIALEYSSVLINPKIVVALERRKYDAIYEREYETVDLQEYVLNTLTPAVNEFEYEVTDNLVGTSTFTLNLKENLKTGTYKLVFKLYNGTDYIGETHEYVIIK